MQAQLKAKTDRASVRSTVSGNGYQADGSTHPPAATAEAADIAAARRRFEAIIAQHQTAMRASARRLCRSHFDAEDVVQESLLRAFRAGAQLDDPVRVRAWLLRIVINTFIDLIRDYKKRRQVELVGDDVAAPDPDEPSPWDHISADDVRAKAELLPDDVRDTYRMFTFEGLDYAAIAEAQTIPPATVGSRIFRARRQLRALLAPSPAENKRPR